MSLMGKKIGKDIAPENKNTSHIFILGFFFYEFTQK